MYFPTQRGKVCHLCKCIYAELSGKRQITTRPRLTNIKKVECNRKLSCQMGMRVLHYVNHTLAGGENQTLTLRQPCYYWLKPDLLPKSDSRHHHGSSHTLVFHLSCSVQALPCGLVLLLKRKQKKKCMNFRPLKLLEITTF